MLERDYIRRGVAEFVGTFALVFVAAGGAAYARSPTDLALANGLVIAVMVSSFAFISGGHFNPAITLAFRAANRITTRLAVIYWIAQFLGATVAAAILRGFFHHKIIGAVPHAPVFGAGKGFLLELIMTFFLVWVVFATAVDPRGAFKQISGLAIGFTIAFGVLMAYGLTGGAMNPARAFGPQLAGDHWKHFWVWYLGPFSGAVIAAALYELLYLRSPRPVPVGPPETGVEEPGAGDAALR